MKYDHFLRQSAGFRKIEYNWRDVILYALGVGASEKELNYVYEKNLKTIPSFGTLPCFNTVHNEPMRPLPYPASELVADALRRETGGPVNGLHLSLEYIQHRPIDPIKGTLLYEDVIEKIYDWKDRGVVIASRMPVYDEAGRLVAENRSMSAYFAGGNFGGEEMPKNSVLIPDRDPDLIIHDAFSPVQNLIYRLSGDTNAGHVDPDIAARYGQPRPFMQGLCSYGYACRMAVSALIPSEPERFERMSAQMRSIAFPGDRMELRIWKIREGYALFRLVSCESGKPILDKGEFEWK